MCENSRHGYCAALTRLRMSNVFIHDTALARSRQGALPAVCFSYSYEHCSMILTIYLFILEPQPQKNPENHYKKRKVRSNRPRRRKVNLQVTAVMIAVTVIPVNQVSQVVAAVAMTAVMNPAVIAAAAVGVTAQSDKLHNISE